ncbi:cytosolic iron-sulfur protein assembly protein [Diplogelasinospora grovesii]|uniref:Probable cytosolic iron-sulfur protein assembly protein 1 n=1 Tax=Diplogelasinospora grovesii TaxID=303347 RepID=A0AAN6NI91_9PEZI|nr:cytosolic iron-sulfur protein assembly protein [Diplogelasinospora grovesii]
MAPPPSSVVEQLQLEPLPEFTPDLYTRAWSSVPHPTLPLIATSHATAVTVFSLTTFTKHSSVSGGHERSVRSATWKPALPAAAGQQLCLVTASFDGKAGLWRYKEEPSEHLATEITTSSDEDGEEWEFTVALEGHENEVKCASFSPSGNFLATCSRDKSVWIWEDVGASEGDDDWETTAILNEHDGDVKAVAWCPDTPGRNSNSRGRYSADVLASASYDNTVRIWREDVDGEWVCVAVLEGHEGTVWGLEWEDNDKKRGGEQRFPRLLTYSADATIRIWTLQEEQEEQQDEGMKGAVGTFVPNVMRRGLKEDWICTSVLPKIHTRDIYSASWSRQSGMVASTGSDGVVVVYGETEGDGWKVLATVEYAHGPYEINHVTWCKRFDKKESTEGEEEEEMLVTTGDDGIVRPWKIKRISGTT